MLTLQMTRCGHDSMNRQQIEVITYIYVIISQVSIFNFHQHSIYFEQNQILRRFRNSQNAKCSHLTSWRYMFNVTQIPVKKRYRMALTLVRPDCAYVDVV